MNNKKILRLLPITLVTLLGVFGLTGCEQEKEEELVLRVSNWEEYIDLGEWDEEEVIDLDEETEIFGENSMVDDFEEWYFETYGKKIRVEYSTFGTNEELYNQLTIGDTYDLVCPSEYMIMKMMREDMLIPFSEDFKDTDNEYNYYTKNLSPYIADVYENLSIEGESINKYAAGYMWGTLGFVYNPEEVSKEDASKWGILLNEDYAKRITIKDSVRDAYFPGVGILYEKELNGEMMEATDRSDRIYEVFNRSDKATVDGVEEVLTNIKENVYSFETDSGKADMVTGKVVANEQWSGDAVYTMDQAEEDEVELCYAVPEEGSNLWFDGWVMLKCGIEQNPEKQQAAEAFVNFVSRPDNAVRNMYYIGYTSVIAGGEDTTVFDYLNWNYGVEEGDEEEAVEYNVAHLFTRDESEYDDYTVLTYEDQLDRQLYAQYPTLEVMERCAVMKCFDDESNERVNRMWTNVRCFDIGKFFGKD